MQEAQIKLDLASLSIWAENGLNISIKH
jgi:hypothetical protein